MLLLVRHGETTANRDGRYLGRADPPLTPAGRAQIERVAQSLPPADIVITSPLLRARETAAYFSVRPVVDERWIELDYGPLDLAPVGDLPDDVVARWRSDPDFAPPGVETFTALSDRVHRACDELRAPAESGTVVVVTHVSPIVAAVGWGLGIDTSLVGRVFVEDAAVSRIDIVDGRTTLRWFNRSGDEPGHGSEELADRVRPRR